MNERILVVEDEAIVADDIQSCLQSLGYDVPTTAASGTEALAAVEAARPRLVLMDIKLQGQMDGIEAAGLLRERYDLPVVYLTSHSDEATLARAVATLPHGYLLKPFNDRELRTVIEVALHRSDMEARRAEQECGLAVSERLASISTMAAGVALKINDPLVAVTANISFAVNTIEALRAELAAGAGGVPSGPERSRTVAVLDELCYVLEDGARGGERVRRIVEDLKRLSTLEDGARRTLVDLPDVEKRARPVVSPRGAAVPPRRGRVLVLDDEASLGRSVERALQALHDVFVEADATAALSLLASGEDFDMILCDVMMPGMGGVDFYEALVVARPELAPRVVFVTGGVFTLRARAFLDSSTNRRVAKAFTVSSLRAVAADYVM